MLDKLFISYKGTYEHFTSMPENPKGAIVILSANDNEKHVDKLNNDLKKLSWVLLILTTNELGSDIYKKISHPNIRIWLQTPHDKDRDIDRFLPLGYPSDTNYSEYKTSDKVYDWMFAGQVTHSRRKSCVRELKKLDNGFLLETQGFGQGLDHFDYIKKMAQSKVIPCPGGPETPDTYRVYEALELGSIPVLDNQFGKGDYKGDYWSKVLGRSHPLRTIDTWTEVADIIESELANYESRLQEVSQWWKDKKTSIANNILSDVNELRGEI